MLHIIAKDQLGKVYLDVQTDGYTPEEPFRILRYVEDQLKANDKELFGGELNTLGIREIATNGVACSSAELKGATNVATGANSCIIGGSNVPKNNTVLINTDDGIVDTGIKITLYAYNSGLALNLGRKGTNFLGQTFDSYYSKMTSKQMKTGGIGTAKLFKSWKDLEKTLEKYKETFRYIAANNPMTFSAEIIGDGVADNPAVQENVKAILDYCNGVEKDLTDHHPIPEVLTEDGLKEEALHRMKQLQLWDRIITKYKKNDTVYMSENYGTIYDLDEEAQKAVTEVRKCGFLPYHVVKTHLMGRPVYDVLFVSHETDDWEYERPDRDGYLESWCWMTDCQDYEMGSIQVTPISGGLRRIA